MAYPPQPVDLPVTSTNETGNLDYHPQLHNAVNQGVLDIADVLGPAPNVGNSPTAFATVQARLDFIQGFIVGNQIGSTPAGPAGGSLTGSYPNPGIANNVITTANLSTALNDGAPGVATLRSLGASAQQATAGNDARLTNARPPTGGAGGSLTGTFPSPLIAPGAIDASMLSTTLADGTPSVATMRSLGTGGSQATAGNDARLSDARPPAGTAGGSLTGSYPNPGLVTERSWTRVIGTAPGQSGPIQWHGSVANPNLASGDMQCSYLLIGKTLHFQYTVIIAADTNTGSGRFWFSLPIDASRGQLSTPGGSGRLDQVVSAIGFRPANASIGGWYAGTAKIPKGTINFELFLGGANGFYVTNTSPWTWGAGDTIYFGGSIEVS